MYKNIISIAQWQYVNPTSYSHCEHVDLIKLRFGNINNYKINIDFLTRKLT